MKSYVDKKWMIIILIVCVSCTSKAIKKEVSPGFKPFFDEYDVQGCFILYDLRNDDYKIYNSLRCEQGFLPASSFKILNAMIGLETGVVTSKDMVIPWDGVVREVESWNRDHTLASAIQNSVVPYFQEMARRIGPERMKKYVYEADYGQMDVTAQTIDHFWLKGNSRITPWEQMNFLLNFYQNKLPISETNIDIVKQLIILEENDRWIFRGKTGWAVQEGKNIGWLIGYYENDKNTWLYVCNVEASDDNIENFKASRRGITEKVFKSMGLME